VALIIYLQFYRDNSRLLVSDILFFNKFFRMVETIFPEFIINSFIFRLLVASFLGGVIGFERGIHGRSAGLRTNLLVSLGAAVFMLLSESIAISFGSDASRIAAQIVTGIGFLGAGAIIKSGFSISGLTTAACLWISAAIGMSAGAGYFDIALATTVISLFTLILLNKFETFYSKDSYRYLEVVTSIETDIKELIDLIKRKHLKIIYLDKERNYKEDIMKTNFTIKLHRKDATDKQAHNIIDDIEKSGFQVHKIKWRH